VVGGGDRLHCGMRRPAESRSAAVVRADTVEFAHQRENEHVQSLLDCECPTAHLRWRLTSMQYGLWVVIGCIVPPSRAS